ncbi:hypothetical protein WD019_15045 [Fictibacillus sp. Mic-4]|uniref:hypothetical protein n=1 Tax=Fictibacillus sp. Mic-4 TaxID=3132826 RepID=UPI003CEF46F4
MANQKLKFYSNIVAILTIIAAVTSMVSKIQLQYIVIGLFTLMCFLFFLGLVKEHKVRAFGVVGFYVVMMVYVFWS